MTNFDAKLPFWQTDYLAKIEKMTWKELLNEIVDTIVPNSDAEPDYWYYSKSYNLLVTRIEDMEEELNAFQEFQKLQEGKATADVTIKS